MSKGIFIVWIGALLTGVAQGRAGEIEDFIDHVNTEWASKNYTNMYQVMGDRLTVYTNDLSALLLKMNYYLMVDYNLSLAQSYVPLFTNTVLSLDWSSDPAARTICMGIINEVVNPTEAQAYGVVYGLSSNQLEAVHAQSPTSHPFAAFALRVGTVQYDQSGGGQP